MRRSCFIGPLMAALICAAGAQAGQPPNRDGPAEARRILSAARASAENDLDGRDRQHALLLIGQALVDAGDEDAGLEIDAKLTSTEMPPPIVKAVAVARLRRGRLDLALAAVRSIKDVDGIDLTLMAMAQAADDGGDAELAQRLCRLTAGAYRVDALLLAARMLKRAGDFDGSQAALDSAKGLAVRQPEVAKIAETEALLGNIERAERLLGRLRRERDRASVLKAVIAFNLSAGDFDAASLNADLIYSDYYRSGAVGEIALAHAGAGDVKAALGALDNIFEDETRRDVRRRMIDLEYSHGAVEAARQIAASASDSSDLAMCLSALSLAASRSGNAKVADQSINEARALIEWLDVPPSNGALLALVQGLADAGSPADALAFADEISDPDVKLSAVCVVLNAVARRQGADAARAMLRALDDPRERASAAAAAAEGLSGRPMPPDR